MAFVVRTPNGVAKRTQREPGTKPGIGPTIGWGANCPFPKPSGTDSELMAYKYTAPATFHRTLQQDKYRILIVGHANAGKTSILQRVADTTNSPSVYRGNKEARDLPF